MTSAATAPFEALMKTCGRFKASDLHLHPGCPPRMRVYGELREIEGQSALEPEALEQGVLAMLQPEQRSALQERGVLDFHHIDAEGVSWRCHAYRVVSGVAAAMRRLSQQVPTLAELKLPPLLRSFADLTHGLVLVAGATGAGKSTTLASLVQRINTHYRRTIVCLEDPIEHELQSAESLVIQRGAGTDVESIAHGLADTEHGRPDVLVVGEVRSREAARGILRAAASGCLVLTTLHGVDAAQSVERFLDIFGSDQQELGRNLLADTLKAVVTQVLLPRADGTGRLPACEILLSTPAVAHLIRAGRLSELRNCMETGRGAGMQTMDDALAKLLRAGEVRREDAVAYARHAARLPGMATPVSWSADRGDPQSERRHEPRLRTINLVNVLEHDNVGFRAALTAGKTLDLSRDGIRVQLNHPLLLGSTVDLAVALSDRVVKLRGVVRDLQEVQDGCAIGMRFVDLEPEAREAVDEYLRLKE